MGGKGAGRGAGKGAAGPGPGVDLTAVREAVDSPQESSATSGGSGGSAAGGSTTSNGDVTSSGPGSFAESQVKGLGGAVDGIAVRGEEGRPPIDSRTKGLGAGI